MANQEYLKKLSEIMNNVIVIIIDIKGIHLFDYNMGFLFTLLFIFYVLFIKYNIPLLIQNC